MADRTVRAIFEAKVDSARNSVKGYASDIQDADKKTTTLQKSLDKLGKAKVKPEIDLKIADAEKKVKDLSGQLESLAKQDATPEVLADISKAEKNLATAESDLKALQGAKAEMVLTADTSGAEDALAGVEDTAAQVGSDSGDEMGRNLVSAFAAIPIAGAVVGLGAAITAGLVSAIRDGLSIEAGRDLFSARTGLDEATANRFGRAAGEAYADAWGESVDANLETARVALSNGLLDENAVQAEAEHVISSLSGVTDILQADIPEAAEAAGALIKTGMAADFDEAMDIIVTGYQNGADRSGDFLDTLREYPSMLDSVGLSGRDMGLLLSQSMEAGARSSDLAADALKEFSIRGQENSEASRAAFESLGLSADDMTSKIAEGGERGREGLDQVLDGLRAMEDPVARNAAGVALFGTQWEDLGNGAGVLAMDLDDLSGSWDGVAGAAADALATMSDNAATQIESAQRNIEIAADGIKGALAAAFGDDIEGFAVWVQSNRAAVMEFLGSIINGVLNFGIASVDAAASAYEAFASFAASAGIPVLNMLAGIAEAVDGVMPGDQGSEAFREFADSAIRDLQRFNTEAPVVADGIRNSFGGALEEVQDDFNSWLAPEIMSASIHDGVQRAIANIGDFQAAVESVDGTVEINGDTLNAEEALAWVEANIDESTGTVTINGDAMPADEARAWVTAQIDASAGTVTVNGETKSAEEAAQILLNSIDESTGTVTVDGETMLAERALAYVISRVNAGAGSISIGARNNTTPTLSQALSRVNASRASINIYAIDHASARARAIAAAISQTSASIKIYGQRMLHDGGTVPGPGGSSLASGWVPGTRASYDNVSWPTTIRGPQALPGRVAGGYLSQPLSGGEYVVNAQSAAANAALLQTINATRGTLTRTTAPLSLDGAPITAIFPGLGAIQGVIRQEIVSDNRKAKVASS